MDRPLSTLQEHILTSARSSASLAAIAVGQLAASQAYARSSIFFRSHGYSDERLPSRSSARDYALFELLAGPGPLLVTGPVPSRLRQVLDRTATAQFVETPERTGVRALRWIQRAFIRDSHYEDRISVSDTVSVELARIPCGAFRSIYTELFWGRCAGETAGDVGRLAPYFSRILPADGKLIVGFRFAAGVMDTEEPLRSLPQVLAAHSFAPAALGPLPAAQGTALVFTKIESGNSEVGKFSWRNTDTAVG